MSESFKFRGIRVPEAVENNWDTREAYWWRQGVANAQIDTGHLHEDQPEKIEYAGDPQGLASDFAILRERQEKAGEEMRVMREQIRQIELTLARAKAVYDAAFRDE